MRRSRRRDHVLGERDSVGEAEDVAGAAAAAVAAVVAAVAVAVVAEGERGAAAPLMLLERASDGGATCFFVFCVILYPKADDEISEQEQKRGMS